MLFIVCVQNPKCRVEVPQHLVRTNLQFILLQAGYNVTKKTGNLESSGKVGYQVLTSAGVKTIAFWDIAPCSQVTDVSEVRTASVIDTYFFGGRKGTT
jgi:hypothetical protein